MVILDIKLENWFYQPIQAKELGQNAFSLRPPDTRKPSTEAIKGQIRSHRWNPLDCVSRSDLLVNGLGKKLPQSLSGK